jgi:hypothetical protein
MKNEEKGSSRRDFLSGAGILAAGALAAGGVVGALAPASANAAEPLPWPYVTLDPQSVAEAAYWAYKTAGCMYGTGKAMVDALAVATGSHWSTFNPDLLRFGAGGIAHWGGICGSINAGAVIIQMTAGSSAAALINEYYGWYCDFAFPSTRVDHLSAYPNQPTSIAASPLCHNSSGIWAYTYGYRIGSNERKERCAKVAADCAYKAVELLNAWKTNSFVPTKFAPDYQDATDFERCFGCHVGPTSKYDNAQGKMDCLASGCHSDKVNHK